MGISMEELMEYHNAIEDMKKEIDEYCEENGELVCDFPVFKERIMSCLQRMEDIISAEGIDKE